MISRFVDEYAWLSNFYESPIIYKGIEFHTVEHAYQAAKQVKRSIAQCIASLPTPGQAKIYGKTVPLKPNWESIKLEIMHELLLIKFNNEWLAGKLLETGNEELIEGNKWNDTFWGVCNGKGQNHLGKLLMKVREELRHGTR